MMGPRSLLSRITQSGIARGLPVRADPLSTLRTDQRRDPGLDLVRIREPDDHGIDPPLRVDDHRGREAVDVKAAGPVAVRADEQRIVRHGPVLLAPLADLLGARAARLDPEHDELPGVAVNLPDLVQLGGLLHARLAPGGEEVDHDGPPAQLGEPHGVAREVGKDEVGRGRTRGPRLARSDREREARAEEHTARSHCSARSAAAMKWFMNASGPFSAVKRLITSRKPTPTSTSPDPISSARKWRFTLAVARRNRSMLQPASRNGTASPAEYTSSSPIPCTTVSRVPASARIAARIGPMHGDQPSAKPAPTSAALNAPRRWMGTCQRVSR